MSTPFQRWLGACIIALSLLSVIFVAIQTARLSDATKCQSQYNEAYAQAIQARSLAARDERQAIRELLTTFLTQELTEAQARAAMDRYLDSLDKADKVRDGANLPSLRC